MIFQRAIRRELVSTASAVFTTLFTITLTTMLIRILGQAAGGKISSQDVLALIGYSALNYMPIIVILSSFISVLLVLTRSYQDSEMVVWFASGTSLLKWVRPVLTFALPLVLLTGVLSFFLTPWSQGQSAELRESFSQREDISRVTPGRFMESASSNRVFFVEGISGDATRVKNVFVSTSEEGQSSIVVANEGSVETNAQGERFVVLHQGRRYEGTPLQPDFRLMEFERYGIRVGDKVGQAGALAVRNSRALPTLALVKIPTPVNLAELMWRASLPLMALLLTVLAIPMSFGNPRGGRSMHLIIAVLIFVVYSNGISIFQSAVKQERLSVLLAWWPMHLMVIAIVVLLFTWRMKTNSPYHPLILWGAFKRTLLSRREPA